MRIHAVLPAILRPVGQSVRHILTRAACRNSPGQGEHLRAGGSSKRVAELSSRMNSLVIEIPLLVPAVTVCVRRGAAHIARGQTISAAASLDIIAHGHSLTCQRPVFVARPTVENDIVVDDPPPAAHGLLDDGRVLEYLGPRAGR